MLAHNIGDKFLAQKIWNACRTAMLQGGQPVSNRDELQVIGWLRSDYNSDDKRDPNAPLFMLGSNDPSETWGVKYIPLSGNSPVIPSGWVMVPKEPTQAMIKAWLSEVANFRGHAAGYKAALAAAPQREVK
ncbi:eaa protein [Salmonella enterica subsp. enterica serovar Apeyeme]|nr:eaa protein [Salmonella enterica subsp. enterica serovar Apeyeme]